MDNHLKTLAETSGGKVPLIEGFSARAEKARSDTARPSDPKAPPMTLHISAHAIERFLERVDPRLTWDEARTVLSGPVIAKAAQFGAPYVKLGTGQRIVLEGSTVVTVLPKDERLGCLRRVQR